MAGSRRDARAVPVQRAPVWLSVDGGSRPPSAAINLIPEQETPRTNRTVRLSRDPGGAGSPHHSAISAQRALIQTSERLR